jgi:uncharacterized LabA/DUF88 family protein
MDKSLRFKLKGETAVFVDWANVYGWKKSLKQEVDPRKLYKYITSYKEVRHIFFYFGTDTHPKSKAFLLKIKKIGYHVITKPVKHILVAEINGQKIYKRKCDFDMEISLKTHELLSGNIRSFIFLTGDGDFEPLYKLLIERGKQVIFVYSRGHLGREIWNLKKGIFKVELPRLMAL